MGKWSNSSKSTRASALKGSCLQISSLVEIFSGMIKEARVEFEGEKISSVSEFVK